MSLWSGNLRNVYIFLNLSFVLIQMDLVNKLGNLVKNNLEFLVANSLYLSSNVLDYITSVNNFNDRGFVSELNPVVKHAINSQGIDDGILYAKLIGVSVGISFFTGVYYCYKKNLTQHRADYYLYGGTLATAIGPLVWNLAK